MAPQNFTSSRATSSPHQPVSRQEDQSAHTRPLRQAEKIDFTPETLESELADISDLLDTKGSTSLMIAQSANTLHPTEELCAKNPIAEDGEIGADDQEKEERNSRDKIVPE